MPKLMNAQVSQVTEGLVAAATCVATAQEALSRAADSLTPVAAELHGSVHPDHVPNAGELLQRRLIEIRGELSMLYTRTCALLGHERDVDRGRA